jgi:hypothetical protein
MQGVNIWKCDNYKSAAIISHNCYGFKIIPRVEKRFPKRENMEGKDI